MSKEDGTKVVILATIAISPIYYFLSLQAKTTLDKDRLHLVILHCILLLIYRYFHSRATPVGIEAVPIETKEFPSISKTTTEEKQVDTKPTRRTRTSQTTTTTLLNPLHPATLLDSTTRSFLSITSPSHLVLLPPLSTPIPTATATPASLPLSSWESLFSSPPSDPSNLTILQHPSQSTLYAIQYDFPSLPLRNLFLTLCDLEKRVEWDSMCEGAVRLEDVRGEGRKASVGWMAIKGMKVVKAKDMVLLSVVGQLPSLASTASASSSMKVLYCATTSISHPSKPITKQYNRMNLSISGFLAEELPGGGSRVTQVTDLSGLGSWVPSAIIRTVTQTLIPKSLTRLGIVAATAIFPEYDSPSAATQSGTLSECGSESEGSIAEVTRENWLPPVLGSYTSDSSSSSYDDDDDDDISSSGTSSETSLEQDESTPPLQSLPLHKLLSEIQSLTSRLKQLEQPPPVAPTFISQVQDILTSENTWTVAGLVVGGLAVGVGVKAIGAWGGFGRGVGARRTR